MKEILEKLSKIRQQLGVLYQEKNELEEKLIKEIVENKQNKYNIAFTNKEFIDIVYILDKKIDYEKLKSQYPEIYELGITPSFSATQALLCMEKELFDKVLKEVIVMTPHYEVRYRSKKKFKKYRKEVK